MKFQKETLPFHSNFCETFSKWNKPKTDAGKELVAEVDNLSEQQIASKLENFVQESVTNKYMYMPRGISNDVIRSENRARVDSTWETKYW